MKKRHNRLSAILLSMFMCISSATLPVYAQDAGTETPIPEQEPETEVIVSEEESAETEEEPAEVIVQDEENPADDAAVQEEPDPADTEEQEPVIEEEPEPAPEEPAEVPEAEEEETDSSVFADESWTLRIELGSEDATLDGWETETVYDGTQESVFLPWNARRDGYTFEFWALEPVGDIDDPESYTGTKLGINEWINPEDYFQDGSRTLTIYAVWGVKRWFEVNYHFNMQGAKFNWLDEPVDTFTSTQHWSRSSGYLDPAEAPGQVFLGWAYDPDASEEDKITAQDITADYWDEAASGCPVVDVYGIWRETGNYVIQYEAGENAAFEDGETTKRQEMTEAATSDDDALSEPALYDIPVSSDSLLVFKEWKVEKDGSSSVLRPGDPISKTIADDFGVNDGSVTTLTVTAVFVEGETYTATFHVGEGVTVSGSGVKEVGPGVYESTFTSFDVNEGRSLPTEENSGYKPLWTLKREKHYPIGWYTNPDFTGEPCYELNNLFGEETPENVELWLSWEKMGYSVRFYPNLEGAEPVGAKLSANGYASEYIIFDEDVVLDQTFIHPEYVLKGWNTDKAKAEAGVVQYHNGENIGKYFETAEGPLSLYGVWVKDSNQKHVYYDPIYGDVEDIGGQLSAAGWFTHVFQKNDVVVVNQECVREGYVLKGWNTSEEKAKEGIVRYHNGDSLGKYFAKGAKDLVLYAVWKAADESGKVEYHPVVNGAVTEDGRTIYFNEFETAEFRADEEVEIDMTFTHPDFTFLGWATSEADADNRKVTYENGVNIGRYFAVHDGSLALYAVWEPDFGMINYHPNRSGALPVKGWLSQSGYQTAHFYKDQKVIINQEMIHPGYILQGWATSKKNADKGIVEYKNNPDPETGGIAFEEFFGGKEEIDLYGVWKAGKGLVTSVSVPEQTIYENWNASENSYMSNPEDTEVYDLTPANITVKADGKTYKGSPAEVEADIEADTGTDISVELSDMYASGDYMPNTAKIKVGGIGTTYKVKFVKNPVTVSIPQNTKIFEDDKDAAGMYDFKPESMTVKAGKKTYTGDFDTVADKLGSAQKIEMQLTDWPYWTGADWHAIRMDAEKYAGHGRGFALYGYSTEFVDGPIKSIVADDLRIIADSDYSVYYETPRSTFTGSVTKDRLVEAVFMTVYLKDDTRIEGQLADINRQLEEKYGAHYRNVRIEGEGDTRTLYIGSHSAEFAVDETDAEPAGYKVAVGKSITIKPDFTDKKVTWTAPDANVAKVTSKGKVTGVTEGVARIRAHYDGGIPKVFYVEVVPAATIVDVRYLGSDENYHGSVSGRTLKLDEDTFSLEADVYPEKAIQKVTWTSSNRSIAEIDEKGKVTRIKNGTVTFTAKATDGTGKKASVKVTFASFVENLEITGPTQVAAGKKITLKTLATRADGKTPTNKAVTWKSLDTSVAKVSSKGVVTAVKGKEDQTVTIIAIAKDREGRRDEKVGELELKVTSPVTSVKLKDPAGEYINGKTVKVSGSSYTITPEIAGNESNTLKWTSAKTSVAEVDQNGVVTKKKNGTVKITAAATDGTGKKATVTLKFTD